MFYSEAFATYPFPVDMMVQVVDVRLSHLNLEGDKGRETSSVVHIVHFIKILIIGQFFQPWSHKSKITLLKYEAQHSMVFEFFGQKPRQERRGKHKFSYEDRFSRLSIVNFTQAHLTVKNFLSFNSLHFFGFFGFFNFCKFRHFRDFRFQKSKHRPEIDGRNLVIILLSRTRNEKMNTRY